MKQLGHDLIVIVIFKSRLFNKHLHFLVGVNKTVEFLRTSGGMQQLIIFLYSSTHRGTSTSVTRM